MNQLSLQKLAEEWIQQIEKTKKLNKQSKHAVISFAIWIDNVIRNEEKKEDLKHDQEN